MAIFNSYVTNYQRAISPGGSWLNHRPGLWQIHCWHHQRRGPQGHRPQSLSRSGGMWWNVHGEHHGHCNRGRANRAVQVRVLMSWVAALYIAWYRKKIGPVFEISWQLYDTNTQHILNYLVKKVHQTVAFSRLYTISIYIPSYPALSHYIPITFPGEALANPPPLWLVLGNINWLLLWKALGLSLPYSSSSPATSPEKWWT